MAKQIDRYFDGTLLPMCLKDHIMKKVYILPRMQKDEPVCRVCHRKDMIQQKFYFECSECEEYLCISCGAMARGLVNWNQRIDSCTFEYQKDEH